MSGRMALGPLIIRERLGLSATDTVENLTEDPCVPLLVGFRGSQAVPSLRPFLIITHFCKRLGPDVLNEVNEWIIIAAKSDDGMARKVPVATAKGPDQTHPGSRKPRAEATEVGSRRNLPPADMAYPTALNQLNEARQVFRVIANTISRQTEGFRVEISQQLRYAMG